MHKCRKVNNTKWPKKTDETNHFKIKTRGGFDLTILKVKQIHYKRIEVFTIRFNPKSIAISCRNLLIRLRASCESTGFESTNSFSSWIYNNTSTFACDFEIPRFQITSSNDLVTATRFYHCLIVNLTPLDSC